MKREWQKPVLEMLDVKMTMHNVAGSKYDGDFSNGQPIPIDPGTGQHLDSKS
ncbi:paeninodin family lasso peptide [Neobacillus niacini]|uniref:paeninodin family lasso peptide n=1 Tax=Neobacillus niacini TaxID=86668 RepID=UPI001C8E6B0C|nr:paeninodin family lasso peptide [Neobacillus niacini]MBY0145874.1 paeninodin family lasso peptide [Neobacillus niacini]